tara:strand:- start:757 stop:1026 length:270 start_codon:yes stop_codon:yes gene_type:complete
MKNKHIELVKKWLADNHSVSPEELKANSNDADNYAYAARAVSDDDKADADSAYAAYAAADSAYDAAYSYSPYATRDAAEWVKRYEELTQ